MNRYFAYSNQNKGHYYKSLLLILVVIFTTGCSSSGGLLGPSDLTTVDNLRLVYDENEVVANQVGITVSQSGDIVAIAYDDKTIKVLDLRTGKTVKLLRANFDDLFDLSFNRNSTKVIATSSNGNIDVLDIQSGENYPIRVSQEITRVALSKAEDYIAFGQQGSIVTVYDIGSNRLVNEIREGGNHISGLDFDPNGSNIAIAIMSKIRKRNSAKIYDIQSGREVGSIEKGIYTSLSYNQDGSQIILSRVGFSAYALFTLNWGSFLGTGALNPPRTTLRVYDVQRRTTEILFAQTQHLSVSLYTSGELYNNIFMGSTEDQSFNVIDLNSSNLIYTTRRDGSNMSQRYAKMGIDKKRIYPLYDGVSFLINYTDSNINQIYNLEENSISSFLYSDADENWALVARDGRMVGTQKAVENVAWTERRSNERTSLDATFDQFYTPELPQLLFSGDFIAENNQKLEESIEFAPSVSITSPVTNFSTGEAQITITADIQNTGGGISEVRLMHNGSNISRDLRGFRLASGETQTVTRQFDVPLLVGENRFRLTAFNDSRIESKASEIIVTYEGAQRESDLHIIAIGIDEYQNNRYNLNYGRSDAEAFATMFEQSGERIFGSVNVTRIYDGEATRQNIQSAFERVRQTARPEDTFMFFYAGHGVVNEPEVPSERPDFYMALHDVTQLYGQEELLKERGISATELTNMVSEVEALKKLVVFDACQAGGAIDAFAFRGAAEERAIQQLARSAGVAIIASAESEQFATEFSQLGHGVFTYALIEGLTGSGIMDNRSGSITVQQLVAYLNQAVPDLTQQYRGQTQYPVSFSRGQDFPLIVRE
nr:caspase family protein [Saprospiraceae bacterium]